MRIKSQALAKAGETAAPPLAGAIVAAIVGPAISIVALLIGGPVLPLAILTAGMIVLLLVLGLWRR